MPPTRRKVFRSAGALAVAAATRIGAPTAASAQPPFGRSGAPVAKVASGNAGPCRHDRRSSVGRAASLVVIPAGESPAGIGVQSML
jgi:hypothetical protein